MKSNLRHISYRRLGASSVHTRYLEDDPDLQQFLGVRPRSAADLLRHAPLSAKRLVPPEDLAEAFARYARRHDAPDEVLQSAAALAEGDTQVIVTGQQPGLFAGPLYTIHKAATAVRLARELSALPDGPRVVPVFWNHSDDHDLDEVNRAFFVNQNQDLQRYRLELEHNGEPIRNIRVGRAVDGALDAIDELMPRTEFRDWAFDLVRSRHPDEHLGDGLARVLFGMFGSEGLLVIEPRDLPPSAFEVLPKWCDLAGEVRDRIRVVSEDLTDIGLDVTLDPGTTMMFQLTGDRRVSLADGESAPLATDLSPGVLLRPAWQDATLPSIGFVVGPGELAYLAIVAPLYKTLGVPRPVIVPRSSMTLVEPSLGKLLARFGWDVPDLADGPEALQRTLDSDSGGEVENELETLATHVQRELTRLSGRVAQQDQGMVRSLERVRSKCVDDLDKLRSKLRNSRQNREGAGVRQIRRLCSHLRPRGRLQERVLAPLPFLVSHGRELATELIDAADPFATNHAILEL